ncbi:CHAT domain-containing protein [Aspergillus aurantiobrunneus]
MDEETQTAYNLGIQYREKGQLREAEKYLLVACTQSSQSLGPDNTATLDALEQLGTVYRKLKKLDEAEDVHTKVVERKKAALGWEDPSTLVSINRLGMVYSAQGRLEDAEDAITDTYTGCMRDLGPYHEATLRAVNSLAGIAFKQGDLDKANRFFAQAVEGYKQLDGPKQATTLTAAGNLASVRIKQGSFEQAEKMLLDILQGYSAVPGLLELRLLSNLAHAYDGQGRHLDAETALRRVLVEYERIFGLEHPDTLDIVNRLGYALEEQDQLHKAREMHDRVLNSTTKASGSLSKFATRALSGLVRIARRERRFDEAHALLSRLLSLKEAVFGQMHSETIMTMCDLGDMLVYLKAYADAEATLSEVHRRAEDEFGPDDERTLYTSIVLAAAYEMQGRLSEIEPLVLHLFENYNGQRSLVDGRTGSLFDSLGAMYKRRGNNMMGARCFSRAYEICTKTLGLTDKDTIFVGLRLDKVRRELDEIKHKRNEASQDGLIEGIEDEIPRAFRREGEIDPKVLYTLARLHEARFDETGHRMHLQAAIRWLDTALHLEAPDDPERAERLFRLSQFYRAQYRLTALIDDLKMDIETRTHAVSARAPDDIKHARHLDYLSRGLLDLYEETWDRKYLNGAIEASREAVIVSRDGDSSAHGRYIANAAVALFWRYLDAGITQDLEQAIEMMEPVAQRVSKDEAFSSSVYTFSADMLRFRFQETGNPGDLEEAFRRSTLALDGARNGEQDRDHRLWSLARQLNARYGVSGRIEDLDQAIDRNQTVLRTVSSDHKIRPECLRCMGWALIQRYERTGRLDDLNRAIEHLEEVPQLDKSAPSSRVSVHTTLAEALGSRYQRTGDADDIVAAVEHARFSVRLCPAGYRGRAEALNSLGVQLYARSKLADNRNREADIDEAIDCLETAISLRPQGHIGLAGNLSNLAICLESKFHQTNEVKYLDLAIKKAKQAIEASHAVIDRSAFLGNQANFYGARFLVQNNPEDLDAACTYGLQGWRFELGRPIDRVKAASAAIVRLLQRGRATHACNVAMEVIDFLPTVSSQAFDVSDQQYVIAEFSGISSHLGALLLRDGRTRLALEYLEKGRGVILDLLMGGRMDVTELRKSHPDQASVIERLRNVLSKPDIGMRQDHADTETILRKRQEAATQFNECVHNIRQLPGHERFLLGPTFESMKAGARGGHIVVVNIAKLRSDAVIISEDSIEALALPNLTDIKARWWLTRGLTDKSKNQAEREAKDKQYLDLLAWLWEVCVQPVLEKANSVSSASTFPKYQNGKKRIWWVGCGIASLLPFHAAGKHEGGGLKKNNTFSHVVSSYASSIKMLFYVKSRSRSIQPVGEPNKLLMAGMPTTLGQAPLPGVEEEIEEITETVEDSFEVTSILHPHPGQIVSGLAEFDMVHFACHAVTHPTNPLQGHLILEPPAERQRDAEAGKLTVEKILRMDIRRARIAYLSACSTARNSAARLLDETIHLGSAFQIAGFPHTMGTMWPTPDAVSRDVAAEFYRCLAEELEGWMVGEHRDWVVAWAFHRAVNESRMEWARKPLWWAQFVHFGA